MDIGQEGGCLQLYGGGAGGCPVPRDRYLIVDGWRYKEAHCTDPHQTPQQRLEGPRDRDIGRVVPKIEPLLPNPRAHYGEFKLH